MNTAVFGQELVGAHADLESVIGVSISSYRFTTRHFYHVAFLPAIMPIYGWALVSRRKIIPVRRRCQAEKPAARNIQVWLTVPSGCGCRWIHLLHLVVI